MLEAVSVDAKDEHRVVAIRPKSAFRSLLEIAATREGSGVILVTQTEESPGDQWDGSKEKPPSNRLEATPNPCSGGDGGSRTRPETQRCWGDVIPPL